MQLLKQQTEAFKKLHQVKVGALFMEPGTGKTLTSITLTKSINDIESVLWIGPCQTIRRKDGVISEINKWGGFNVPVEYCGCETLSSSDRTYLRLLAKCRNEKIFIIVDESLKIKNWEAKRTKRIIELGKLAKYRIILNGTPITRNLLDIWSQMEFLSPQILNMSITQFENIFCETVTIKRRINGKFTKSNFIAKYHNVDYLYSLIKHYVYECDLSLTIEKEHIQVGYVLCEETKEEYERLKAKYLDNETLLAMNNNIFLEMTTKMQHNYCITEDKFRKLNQIIERHGKEKVLVYCKYIKSYKAIQEKFKEVEVLTYGRHALGLNKQDYNITVYFDKTFDFMQMTQSEFRTFRTGQTRNCLYYSLTGNVGLETMINDNLFKKRSLLDYFKKVGAEQIKKEL